MKQRRGSKTNFEHEKAGDGRGKPERFGMDFEEWMKSKHNAFSVKFHDTALGKPDKMRCRNISKGISYDEWKTKKIEELKLLQISAEATVEDDRKDKRVKSGITFEQWLESKTEQNKYRLQLEGLMRAQEERRTSFMMRFRLDDPRQRTFEEWYWEKEEQMARERKQRKELQMQKVRSEMKYPDDANLIFDMWLSDKFHKDIDAEKRKLKKSIMKADVILKSDDNSSTDSFD